MLPGTSSRTAKITSCRTLLGLLNIAPHHSLDATDDKDRTKHNPESNHTQQHKVTKIRKPGQASTLNITKQIFQHLCFPRRD